MRRTSFLLLALLLALATGVALIAAATTRPTSPAGRASTAEDKAVVRRFYAALDDALRSGRSPALDGLVAPDLLASSGRSSDGDVRQTLDGLVAAFAGAQLTVESLLADDGQVVALVSIDGGRHDLVPGHTIHGEAAWSAIDRFSLVDGAIVAFVHWEQGQEVASARPLLEVVLDRLPAAPAAMEVNRVTLPLGAHLPGLIGAGPELLVLEQGVLAVEVTGRAWLVDSAGQSVVEGGVRLGPGDGLVVPTGSPFIIDNGGQTPAVFQEVVLRSTAERSAENSGIDSSALRSSAVPWNVGVQRLAAGVAAEHVSGPAVVSVARLTLQAGAGIAPHDVAGAELLAVEGGTLDLAVTTETAHLLRTGGAASLGEPSDAAPGGWDGEREGALLAGEGAFLPGGIVYTMRSTDLAPVVLLVVRVVPVGTDGR